MMWDAPDRKKARLKSYARQVFLNGGIIAFLVYTDIFRYSKTTLYIYIGVLTFITLMQLLNARINIKKQAEKLANNKDNQAFFLEAHLDISEAGITRKDENQESKTQWKAFIKKQETPQYYFLFTSAIQSFIIPKRILKTAEEKQQLEKLMTQYLSFDAEVGHLIKE
jgi:hypothetical protein